MLWVAEMYVKCAVIAAMLIKIEAHLFYKMHMRWMTEKLVLSTGNSLLWLCYDSVTSLLCFTCAPEGTHSSLSTFRHIQLS